MGSILIKGMVLDGNYFERAKFEAYIRLEDLIFTIEIKKKTSIALKSTEIVKTLNITVKHR